MRINPPMLLQINRSYLKLVKGDNFPRYCFQRWFGADYSHTETPTTKCFISCSHFIFIHGIQLLPGTIFSLFFHTHPHQKHTVERSKFFYIINSNFNEFWQKMAADSTWVSKIILYSFWQSSCSWRIRFALNLKGLFLAISLLLRYNFYAVSFLGFSNEELFDC